MAFMAPVGAALAAASPYLGAASAGMTIIGGMQQSAAQQQAGQVSYENALLRAQMAQTQATQMDQAASSEEGAGQRQQVEQIRKGQVLAGRARAVMAASGGGVDESVVDSLVGEGNYAGDVAAYNASEKARGLRNQAAMTRYGGEGALWQGANEQSADDAAASNTIVGSIGKAALSFASKYGGDLPGTGSPVVSPARSAASFWLS